ncbi:hypothetical protein CR513_29604, partial [Mucuna pruriens]
MLNTNYICTSIDKFENYHKINPILVSLPNKSIVMIHLARNVKVSYALILRNALFLLEFNINRVSISKLTKTAQCNFTFVGDDLALRKIGLVKLHNGL